MQSSVAVLKYSRSNIQEVLQLGKAEGFACASIEIHSENMSDICTRVCTQKLPWASNEVFLHYVLYLSLLELSCKSGGARQV